jgi:hypothetical protein
MKEVLRSIAIYEIAGNSRKNTACYSKGSGDEGNCELLAITFQISSKRKSIIHALISDTAVVSSGENSSYKALKAKDSE